MSYQVIARKWRPQSFTELIGQDAISQTLLNALKSNRLPHALLFTGPRGTGKTSTARILAKSLRCPTSELQNWVPCQTCDTCLEIAQSRNVDVIEIDGASNNGVEAIRELRETVGYRPTSGRYKIYIIDEVHMLSLSAFNALLKTLEEPPAHVIFILATTEVHKIPQTILSRCQRFDFRRIALREIQEHLQKICTDENLKAEPEALWMIARQGDGSMRDSQSLLEQVITFSQGELTLKKVMEILGLTDRQVIFDTLQAILSREPKAILAILEKYHQTALEPHLLAQDIMESIRHLTIIKVAGSHSAIRILDLPDSEIQWLHKATESLSLEELHFLFDMALKGLDDVLKAHDPRIVLEMVLLRLASAPHLKSLHQLLQNGGIGGTGITNKTSPTAPATQVAMNRSTSEASPSTTISTSSSSRAAEPDITRTLHPAAPAVPPAAPPATAAVAATPTNQDRHNSDTLNRELPIDQQWLQTIEFIKKQDILLGSKLEGVAFLGVQNKTLQVGIPIKMQFLRQQIQDPVFSKKLKAFIEQLWGTGYLIESQIIKDKNQGVSALSVAETKKQLDSEKIKQNILDHPLVKTTQDVFNAQIVTIKDLEPPTSPTVGL